MTRMVPACPPPASFFSLPHSAHFLLLLPPPPPLCYRLFFCSSKFSITFQKKWKSLIDSELTYFKMAAAQISNCLSTSVRGNFSLRFSLFLFISFGHFLISGLLYIWADAWVPNAARIPFSARFPHKDFARIGTTFATGSPLCKLGLQIIWRKGFLMN